MGEMREYKTPRQLCEIWETNPDTLRMRYAKLRQTNADLFPLPWRIDGELSPEQVNELQRAGERKGSQPATKIESESVAHGVTNVGGNLEQGRSNEAAPQELKRAFRLPEMWRTKVFAGLTFCLVIGHAGLIWFDMATLWSVAGKIGGAIVFLFIFSGMVLMSERSEKMEEIRENMLWAVGFLEALSVVVHRAAFYGYASKAYQAGLGDEYIWALSAVICLCSIGATIFYQKVIRL